VFTHLFEKVQRQRSCPSIGDSSPLPYKCNSMRSSLRSAERRCCWCLRGPPVGTLLDDGDGSGRDHECKPISASRRKRYRPPPPASESLHLGKPPSPARSALPRRRDKSLRAVLLRRVAEQGLRPQAPVGVSPRHRRCYFHPATVVHAVACSMPNTCSVHLQSRRASCNRPRRHPCRVRRLPRSLNQKDSLFVEDEVDRPLQGCSPHLSNKVRPLAWLRSMRWIIRARYLPALLVAPGHQVQARRDPAEPAIVCRCSTWPHARIAAPVVLP